MQSFSNVEIFTMLKVAVSSSGSAGRWLGEAYLSWYRGGDARRIDLQEFDSLDYENRLLFTEMLTLRKRDGWRDSDLYRLEQEIKELLAERHANEK